MKRFLSALIGAVVGITLSSPVTISSADTRTVYVKDSAELLAALSDAKAGDEIILAEGTYENEKYIGAWAYFYLQADGTADSPITIRSDNPEKPAVLKGTDANNKIALYITGDYWNIKDLCTVNAKKGIVLDNSCHSKISGCEIYDIGEEGIHIRDDSSYNTIENCNIHDTGKLNPGYGEGVYIGSARGTEEYGFDCHYNTVRGCKLGPNVAAEHIDIKEFTIGTIIENCVFDGTGISGKNYADSFLEVKGNNAIIRGNTGYRNENEIITSAFQLYTADNEWGMDSLIYGNTVYMDDDSSNVVTGNFCTAKVCSNTRCPEGHMYTGSDITVLSEGDINCDGTADENDITELSRFILGDKKAHAELITADLVSDGVIDSFDLCLARNVVSHADDKKSWSYYAIKDNTWRLYNGCNGKNLNFVFKGIPGAKVTLGAGYWDASAVNEETGKNGVWLHPEDEAFGSHVFDENGEVSVQWTPPQGASNIEIAVYYYAVKDETSGQYVKHESSETSLSEITYP